MSNIMNQSRESNNKIFIGGLSWKTTKEMLLHYFTRYGDVEQAVVMLNKQTFCSRGFGFVTFKTHASAKLAFESAPHEIDGKTVEVKPCDPQLAQQHRNFKQEANKCKVFVGGLPREHGVQDYEIIQVLSRFGRVKELKLIHQGGFGFVTFEDEQSAVNALQEHYIDFNGRKIEIKPQQKCHNYNIPNGFAMQQHQLALDQFTWQTTVALQQLSLANSSFSNGWINYGVNVNNFNNNREKGFRNYYGPNNFANDVNGVGVANVAKLNDKTFPPSFNTTN